MTDPKRWREEEGPAIVAVIDALRADEPSAEAREALWAKIAPVFPRGGGGSGPGGGGGRGGGGGGALGAKAIATGIAGVGLVTIIAWIAMRSPPPSEVPNTEPSTPASYGTTVQVPPPEGVSARAVVSAPAPVDPSTSGVRPQSRPDPSHSAHVAPPSSSSSSSSVDRLREEAEGVRRARQHLRDKNPGAALAELERLARLVPAGPLAEEREVLTIEAIAASGDREAARRRAERFLFERPNSVHAARVRALTER